MRKVNSEPSQIHIALIQALIYINIDPNKSINKLILRLGSLFAFLSKNKVVFEESLLFRCVTLDI